MLAVSPLFASIRPRMQPNPFAPPRSFVDDAPLDRVLRKPTYVWLLQLLAGAIGVLFLGVCVRLTLNVIGRPDFGWAAAFQHYSLDIGTLAWASLAVVGSQHRSAYGRRLGLALIGALLAIDIVIVYIGLGAVAREARTHHAAFEVDRAMLLIAILSIGLIVLLFQYFGYSAGSRAWFDERGSGGQRS
jgi:hypothetical protein